MEKQLPPAKVKLGQRPAAIKAVVNVTLLDGSTGHLPVEYVYRTRREFADLIDQMVTKAKATSADAAEEAENFGGNVQRLTVAANADYLLTILSGWGLDEPFGREAVEQLCDELPGAAQAVIDKYRSAITEGRLGN